MKGIIIEPCASSCLPIRIQMSVRCRTSRSESPRGRVQLIELNFRNRKCRAINNVKVPYTGYLGATVLPPLILKLWVPFLIESWGFLHELSIAEKVS